MFGFKRVKKGHCRSCQGWRDLVAEDLCLSCLKRCSCGWESCSAPVDSPWSMCDPCTKAQTARFAATQEERDHIRSRKRADKHRERRAWELWLEQSYSISIAEAYHLADYWIIASEDRLR